MSRRNLRPRIDPGSDSPGPSQANGLSSSLSTSRSA
jgi:hypothetical protein